MNCELNEIQNHIYELQQEANKVIDHDLSLFYGGDFITGNIDNPKFLFLGINPGFYKKEWAKRDTVISRKPFTELPCKFVGEYSEKPPALLASRIVKVILGGDPSSLSVCAETSFRSFYATPNVDILNKQLQSLRQYGLEIKHEELMKKHRYCLIERIKPKHIVCVGLSTFHSYIDCFSDKSGEVSTKSMPSSSGDTERVYYKKKIINDIPVHGLIHLSGARLSSRMRDELRILFDKL